MDKAKYNIGDKLQLPSHIGGFYEIFDIKALYWVKNSWSNFTERYTEVELDQLTKSVNLTYSTDASWSPIGANVKKCNCNLFDMINYGCKCGGV